MSCQRTSKKYSLPSDPHHRRIRHPEPSEDACFVSHSSSRPEIPFDVSRKEFLSSALHPSGLSAQNPRYAASIASAGAEIKISSPPSRIAELPVAPVHSSISRSP